MRTTCDSCGVEWVQTTGVDINDHWYKTEVKIAHAYQTMWFCDKCFIEQNESDFAQSLMENDWGHQPS